MPKVRLVTQADEKVLVYPPAEERIPELLKLLDEPRFKKQRQNLFFAIELYRTGILPGTVPEQLMRIQNGRLFNESDILPSTGDPVWFAVCFLFMSFQALTKRIDHWSIVSVFASCNVAKSGKIVIS
jgi:hypothetical protein